MNLIILKKGFKLLTILSAVTFLVLSTATNSWGNERSSTLGNSLGNQSRSDTNVNNEIRTINDGKGSSENSKDSSLDTNITKNPPPVAKALLSISVKSKIEGQKKFAIEIDGKNPTASKIIFNTANRNLGPNPKYNVALDPGQYEVKVSPLDYSPGLDGKPYYDNDFNKKPYIMGVDPFGCQGSMSFGDHKTCYVQIAEWPRLVVYIHAPAPGIKASDFKFDVLTDVLSGYSQPWILDVLGKESTRVKMGGSVSWGVYIKNETGYLVEYRVTPNLQELVPTGWCYGQIEDNGLPPYTKDICDITIRLPPLKVFVKVEGNTPVGNFKYKINTNDVNFNGKEFNGNTQGTMIPIKPGASYDIQPLQYNNYNTVKSGECDNAKVESGKTKICTVTMTYDVQKDTCHTEINEQGKPVKVC
ncbi:MAG TPA: hypothetical protein VH481_07895 [Nitrososphaeraceae archaeon]